MMNIFFEYLNYLPPELIFKSFHTKKFFFFLDSVSPSYGRYSIVGFEPFLIFKSKGDKITIEDTNSKKTYIGKPFDYLNELLEKYWVDTRFFFIPGAVGYLGYDAGLKFENLPDINPDILKIPDIFFCFYDTFLIFDIIKKKLILTGINFFEKESTFKKKISLISSEIKNSLKFQNDEKEAKIKNFSSNMKFSEYVSSIEKIKNYIKQGDVYQINFSQRFQAEGIFNPSEIYLKIRKINPSGYSAYFDFNNFQILSNSPELFIKKYGIKIITKPMKGTISRGKNRKEDSENKKELLDSEKDRAELIMIVDLERNDIGKICEFGSIKVKKLVEIEKYKTCFQTTSTIEGILKKEVAPVDIIKNIFPGGSITGAPKIRAMEIIEELEPEKRSFYTGSLGYIGFNKNMLLNILIRTILHKENKIYYPVGGGIVWDSIPEKEYEETLIKTKNLFLTLGIDQNAGNLFS
ncbi:MAG TPA: aminodeoxychorismate synthase component I [bacterium]|nr:aminodeoxychorismate synthase component I [bacterium]